jgi:hypothetical protein
MQDNIVCLSLRFIPLSLSQTFSKLSFAFALSLSPSHQFTLKVFAYFLNLSFHLIFPLSHFLHSLLIFSWLYFVTFLISLLISSPLFNSGLYQSFSLSLLSLSLSLPLDVVLSSLLLFLFQLLLLFNCLLSQSYTIFSFFSLLFPSNSLCPLSLSLLSLN